MNKQDLIAALKGGGRTQVDPNIGQVQLNPTLGRYGNYNVVTQPTSKNNSAKQLARALMAAPQVVGQFKNIQEAAGIREANELTTEELETRFDKGDLEAKGILHKLYKDQKLQETVYTRLFNSDVTPNIRKAKAAIKNRNVEELAGMSDEEYRASVQKELTDTLGPEFLAMVKSKPHIARIHNRAMERVIPNTVEELVAYKNKEVKEYTKVMGIANLMDSGGLETGEYAFPVVDSSAVGTDIPFSKATAFGDVNIDTTTAQEVKNGRMAAVKGDPLIGSSGMAYRGLEDSVPTVAVNPKSGLVAGDMIHVVSNLFPDGRVFEVAGTGPDSGRLDFFATSKEDYNKLAKQKLKTVTKLDPESVTYEARAIPVANKLANYSQAVARAVGELHEGFASVEDMTDPERATYIGDKLVNDILFKYEQDGDLKTPDAWLQSALAGNEPFIDGKPYSESAEGKRILLRVGNFVEQEEAANERGANRIGGKASKAWREQMKYDINKVSRAWDKSGKGPEATDEFREKIEEFVSQIDDAPSAHNEDKNALLTFIGEKEDSVETGYTEDVQTNQRQLQAFVTNVGGVGIANRGSTAEGLHSLLMDSGHEVMAGKLVNNDGAININYTAKGAATAQAIFDAALPLVKQEYDELSEEERKNYGGKEFGVMLQEKMQEVLPRFLESVDEMVTPSGVDPEALKRLDAADLEARVGESDAVDKDGRLEPIVFKRVLSPHTAERLAYTLSDPASRKVLQEQNSPANINRALNQLFKYQFNSRAGLYHTGVALGENASAEKRIATQARIWETARYMGLSMEILKNKGQWDFRYPSPRARSRSARTAAGERATDRHGRFNFDSGDTFRDIKTSTERIYNLAAITKYVDDGDATVLKEIAGYFDLDPDKFIPNQVELAEKFKNIDPQPKPE